MHSKPRLGKWGRFPVVHAATGGIVTPTDAALMMQLGCDDMFVRPEIFPCADPLEQDNLLRLNYKY